MRKCRKYHTTNAPSSRETGSSRLGKKLRYKGANTKEEEAFRTFPFQTRSRQRRTRLMAEVRALNGAPRTGRRPRPRHLPHPHHLLAPATLVFRPEELLRYRRSSWLLEKQSGHRRVCSSQVHLPSHKSLIHPLGGGGGGGAITCRRA